MVNSALDYSPNETVRLHQRFRKCAVDFEMLLYSHKQLTVRGRSPRMHFRVYEMRKARFSRSVCTLYNLTRSRDTHCNAILLAFSIIKSFQCTGMFAVKSVFPYQKIHPIFWTASTQYISLHDRSFGGGILQLRKQYLNVQCARVLTSAWDTYSQPKTTIETHPNKHHTMERENAFCVNCPNNNIPRWAL